MGQRSHQRTRVRVVCLLIAAFACVHVMQLVIHYRTNIMDTAVAGVHDVSVVVSHIS